MRIAAHIRALTPYTPGEQPKALSVIKLNTNENAYPPSPKVAKTLAQFDMAHLRRYPDPLCLALRQRLAKIWKTDPACIFVGNGSDEILSLAARAFVEDDETIASFVPSYSLYKTLADIRGVGFEGVPLAPRFVWPKACPLSKKAALFLLTNPNAPTSVLYPEAPIRTFARKFPGVVIVDEAYADFASANCVSLATAPRNRNIIVMRTLSKSFSLAGLRLGYCIGPRDLIDALYKVKDSYNVDFLAQTAALAALNDLPYMRANVAKIRRTRNRTAKILAARGWDVLPSESNFLFARPACVSAARIFALLRARNVFVRYFPAPETKDYLRITIGTDAEMDVFLKAVYELDK